MRLGFFAVLAMFPPILFQDRRCAVTAQVMTATFFYFFFFFLIVPKAPGA